MLSGKKYHFVKGYAKKEKYAEYSTIYINFYLLDICKSASSHPTDFCPRCEPHSHQDDHQSLLKGPPVSKLVSHSNLSFIQLPKDLSKIQTLHWLCITHRIKLRPFMIWPLQTSPASTLATLYLHFNYTQLLNCFWYSVPNLYQRALN